MAAMENPAESSQQSSRIYLGNLLYSVKPSEIEEMLAANGFDCENIHISIDPISGRNPGYCFVNFREADAASRALSSLQGTAIRGRPVKVGPCEPKAPATEPPGESGKHESVFQRWGNWSPPNEMDGSAATSSPGRSGPQQGPHSALEHFENVDPYQGSGGQRLYVGGLGKMINQAQNDKEIRELFADFSPSYIGKRITAHESTRAMPGNHNFCFVDFETTAEASEAMRALNHTHFNGQKVKISFARGLPEKLLDGRRAGHGSRARAAENDAGSRTEPPPAESSSGPSSGRAMESSN